MAQSEFHSVGLDVPSLIRPLLRSLCVETTDDLLALNVQQVAAIDGVGQKKIDCLVELIESAKVKVEGQKPVSNSPQRNIATSAADENATLPYVPNLIAKCLDAANIRSIGELLAFDADSAPSLPGWGAKRAKLAQSLQAFYRNLMEPEPPQREASISKLIPLELLPHAKLEELTINGFLSEESVDLISGTAKQEALRLRSVANRVYKTDQAGDETSDLSTLDWRDVPLKVGPRIEKFLESQNLFRLGDVKRFSRTGQLPDSTTYLPSSSRNNFGERSLEELRKELLKLEQLGLEAYRCASLVAIDEFDYPEMPLQEIPLKIPPRVQDFFDRYFIKTISDAHQVALRAQVYDSSEGAWVSAVKKGSLTDLSLKHLRCELNNLAKLGLQGYRFGQHGPPENANALIQKLLSQVDDRLKQLLIGRWMGKTLQQLAEEQSITRERCRQLLKKLNAESIPFKKQASGLLSELDQQVHKNIFVDEKEAFQLLSLSSRWELNAISEIAECEWKVTSNGRITRFPDDSRRLLIRVAKAILSGSLASQSPPKTIGEAVSYAKVSGSVSDEEAERLSKFADDPWPCDVGIGLLTKEQLATYIRPHLVAAGVNGLSVRELSFIGVIGQVEDIAEQLSGIAERTSDDRFRRRGKTYSLVDVFVNKLRSADRPLSASEIGEAHNPPLQQPVLVGRYLGPSYYIVGVDRGLYVHIRNIGLTIDKVQEIASWSAEILSGESGTIDGQMLYELFLHSEHKDSLDSAHQLVSIAAKHPNVKRVSNNLQLAYIGTFDDSVLTLEAAEPELAAEWHPTKNGAITPADVRPASNIPRWWRCKNGHEFEAMPVYRSRMVRTCPGCQERWNLKKIRHFVASLQEHLDALTPAELYTVFQQSGLLESGGSAKGFVKAAVTGRFPKSEINKFVAGEPSVVDEIIEGADFDLETISDSGVGGDVLDNEKDAHAEDGESGEVGLELPEVKTKATLAALESPVLASTDAEAAEFLVESGKAKLWRHAFRNDVEAVSEAEEHSGSGYSQRVRDEFLEEYRKARSLVIPAGYCFSIDGRSIEPNLMQRHVAAQVQQRGRFGNWSGTGAGKTLSAILATRVCESKLTLVCCPNAVVGDSSSGWTREIIKVFPDSDVQSKTWCPAWNANAKNRYLVLNFEQLQQPDSEAKVAEFIASNSIDFIIIDEVHYAKQRHASQASKRKQLLQALVAEAGQKNPSLKVLGLSATPVINNLQEGKSLIEMITAVEHSDLATKATVPNCMRMHQQLAMLGTRWRPEYEAGLQMETPDIDCSHLLGEIEALGVRPSPLDVEKVLTKARLPAILNVIDRGGPAVVYTHYVTDIDRLLYESMSSAGLRVGLYTGDHKSGLDAFKRGQLDVLIGSSSIGTGVDGIQHVCSRLVINSLPWTNAEFEQLIGRVWRQGQESKAVEVIVPVTYANVDGERWSYCQTKLDRIRYKKSIADAAVDGIVPEGNLRSPAQAQKDILEWLNRLQAGNLKTIERRPIVVPLRPANPTEGKRLQEYGDFSTINNRWNNSSSQTLSEELSRDPEAWAQYHTLYQAARESWPVIPYQEFIRWCQKRSGYVVADFGCGEALVAKALSGQHVVHSFDHVAIDDSVIAGDMSKTPLDDNSVDVAVFSLSLMGTNFSDYLREAYRVLKIDGQLQLWEAESRFADPKQFAEQLGRLGFRMFEPTVQGAFVHMEGRKTGRKPEEEVSISFR